MGPTDHLHSQLVGWAKIILPLCALALLSTLFLFARTKTEPDSITFADVEAIAREQRVSSPEFSGVTDDGAVVVISAASARPDATRADILTVDDMRYRRENTDGTTVEITATEGEMNNSVKIARFTGLTRLTTSDGYQMETNGMTAELRTGLITSDGLLEIRAPFGDLTAGKLTFQTATDGKAQDILFTEGVRLLYTPQTP